MVELKSPVSLYFHIPFCTKKCPYCHFYVVPNQSHLQQAFMEGLRIEWQQKKGALEQKEVVSLYFGGGTPSLLSSPYLSEIIDWCRPYFTPDSEITIEANPEECTLDLFKQFLSIGINRLSLGVQSLDDSSLQEIGRIHSAEKAKQAIYDAHRAGFQNISIDLMYDLPDQTRASWQRTLKQIQSLPITHLSLYNLTVEPHTPFFKQKKQKSQPSSSLSLALLNEALQALEACDLIRYEISAFAKEGRISKHNSGYWTGRPFLGFGPSAYSYWDQKRFSNVANVQRYRKKLLANESATDFSEELLHPDNLHELLAIRLRLLDGAPKQPWPKETKAKLNTLKEMGLLEETDKSWKLTEKGILFYDTVAAELI